MSFDLISLMLELRNNSFSVYFLSLCKNSNFNLE